MTETALLLRTCATDGTSHDGRFQWPLEVDAWVQCDDWDPVPRCGGGLHGLLWGGGNGLRVSWEPDAIWLVIEAAEWVEITEDDDGKAKCPRCVVRHVGDQQSATAYLAERAPGRAIVGATITAGYRGTATAGYRGTATAGYRGTATAGYLGTATAGYLGTATAGYRGTATAGYRGTATAGYRGIIQIRWWDGSRYRIAVGYVGEDGIEAKTAYRCDEHGELVRVGPAEQETP